MELLEQNFYDQFFEVFSDGFLFHRFGGWSCEVIVHVVGEWIFLSHAFPCERVGKTALVNGAQVPPTQFK